jgi:hypothetical protein
MWFQRIIWCWFDSDLTHLKNRRLLDLINEREKNNLHPTKTWVLTSVKWGKHPVNGGYLLETSSFCREEMVSTWENNTSKWQTWFLYSWDSWLDCGNSPRNKATDLCLLPLEFRWFGGGSGRRTEIHPGGRQRLKSSKPHIRCAETSIAGSP